MLLNKYYSSQPQEPSIINGEHPYSKFISFIHTPISLSRNIIDGRSGSLTGTTYGPGAGGINWQVSNTANYGIDFGSKTYINGNIFSIGCLCAPANTTGIKTIFSQRSGAGSLEQTDFVIGSSGLLTSDSRGVQIYYRSTAGNAYYADNGLSNGIPDGNVHLYGTTRDNGGVLSVFRDGVDITVNRLTPTGTFVSTAQKTRLGNLADYTGTGYQNPNPIYLIFVLDGYALSSVQWMDLANNPWSIFEPYKPAYFINSVSAGGATLKTINNLATASLGSKNGISKADIKTVNTLLP